MTKQIEKRLEEWQKADLLTPDQAEAIRRYEARRPSSNRALRHFSLLGAFSISIGIISLIAANWSEISDTLKLTVYFVFLSGIGYAAWRRDETPGLLRETLYTLFSLLLLAGIGLIAQIYHLSSQPWRGPAFWTMLCLGPALRSRTYIGCGVWFAAFGIAWSLWLASTYRGADAIPIGLGLVFLIGILCSYRGPGQLLPETFARTGRDLIVALVLFIVLSFTHLLIFVDFDVRYQVFGTMVVASILSLGILKFSRPAYPSLLHKVWAFILCCGLLQAFLPTFVFEGKVLSSWQNALNAFLFILIWSAVAIGAISLEIPKWFDLAIFLIAARIFIAYIQVFGSLALTGAGLILLGLLILGLVWLWNKKRQKLYSLLKARFTDENHA
ncbi:MAG: DUF2157 domain-containing protein [Oligoflexus sp.]